jgi:hypothetical protein
MRLTVAGLVYPLANLRPPVQCAVMDAITMIEKARLFVASAAANGSNIDINFDAPGFISVPVAGDTISIF